MDIQTGKQTNKQTEKTANINVNLDTHMYIFDLEIMKDAQKENKQDGQLTEKMDDKKEMYYSTAI